MAYLQPRPRVRHHKSGVSKIQRDSYSNKNTQTDWWVIRKEVFERDNGKCQKMHLGTKCLMPGVDVHHIRPLTRGGLTVKSNLITVCRNCHDIAHRNKFSRRA